MSADPQFRPLTAADEPKLRIATLGNLNWTGDRFTEADLDSRPEFAHYARFDAERGDFGIVAGHERDVIGIAWALLLPTADRGFGHVDDHTPELSLWVRADQRGHGLGRELLRLVIAQSQHLGYAALSLSVEAGNPARFLYESEGFVPIAGREVDGVMIRHVTPS